MAGKALEIAFDLAVGATIVTVLSVAFILSGLPVWEDERSTGHSGIKYAS